MGASAAATFTERLRAVLPTGRARLPRGMRRPSLLAHLVVFGLIILIPALLFSAFLILQFSQQQREIAAGQVNDTAEIVSNAVDREIFGLTTTARVLATSPALSGGNLAGFHDRTVAALADTSTTAVLVDSSLDVVLSTAESFPLEPRKVIETEPIERVFKTGRPQVSGVYFGQTSEKFLFHVAVPVIQNGQVGYVLAINKATESLSTVIADRNLPSRWSAVIKDRNGRRVFAVVASDGRMEPQQGISYDNPSIIETFGSNAPDDLLEASIVSNLSGWTTTLAVPESFIVQPALRSWLLLLSAGTLLLLFSVALGLIFGRRIAAPILSLSKQAEAIGRGEPATTIKTDIAEIGEVSKILAQASRDRRDAEEQNRFLMREMTHRAKNQYALVAAIARRAAKDSADTTEFLDTLSEALSSLARSAELLAGQGWDSVGLADLVRAQLAAFGAGSSQQIVTGGPEIRLNPTAAQTIGLALHELATNAAKYGALSVEAGSVVLEWASEGDEFRVRWQEQNGPPVTPPRRSGFGTLVTQKMTARGLGGQVHMEYAVQGVVWELTAPLDAVMDS